MPGIPTYLGCEACRKQKKKCDKLKPACSRCARLDIPCVGVGQTRFRFRDNTSMYTVVDKQVVPARRGAAALASQRNELCRPMSNASTAMVSELVSMLETAIPGYDIFCYGPFLLELPQRLGRHPALDASTAAFTSVISCVQSRHVTVSALRKNMVALRTLQQSVGDPTLAYSPETLCSIFLLLVTHIWLARPEDDGSCHSMGMANLIQAVLERTPRDEFLAGLMGPVCLSLILESVFNPSIQLEPWIHIAYHPIVVTASPTRDMNAAGRVDILSLGLHNLFKVPGLIRNPRDNIREVLQYYRQLQSEYSMVKQLAKTALASGHDHLPPSVALRVMRYQSNFREAQAIMITLGIVFNTFLSMYHETSDTLAAERKDLCAQALVIGEKGLMERPLAALFVPYCLVAAWLFADDAAVQSRLGRIMDELQGDWAMLNFLRLAGTWKDAPRRLRRDLWWFPKGQARDEPESSRRAREAETEPNSYNDCIIL